MQHTVRGRSWRSALIYQGKQMTQTATKVQAPVVIEAKVYELPEVGLHVATILSVEDLGMVKSELYGEQRKVRITYRIEDENGADGTPMLVFETFTASFGKKARLGMRLRSLGVNTDQPSLDISEIAGMRINVNIVHNKNGDRTYANVDSASRIRKSSVAATKIAEEI
jgi:hypothetical protein